MISCANTENQLSLPHIVHVTTNDAVPTVHIHVTPLYYRVSKAVKGPIIARDVLF